MHNNEYYSPDYSQKPLNIKKLNEYAINLMYIIFFNQNNDFFNFKISLFRVFAFYQKKRGCKSKQAMNNIRF